MSEESTVDRRTALKLTGGAATASLAGSAAAESENAVQRVVSNRLDPHSPAPQEALVTFTSNAAVDRLAELSAPYCRLEVLPIGWTELTGDQMRELAGFEEVLRIEANYELDLLNHTSKESNNVADIRQTDELDYRGEGIHAAVIDTGIDPQHPAFDNIAANYQFAYEPGDDIPDDIDTLWIDAGPAQTDDWGHGTHCAGSLAGSGEGNIDDNDYSGMAPQATLTSYSVNADMYLLAAAAAYDHILTRQRDGTHTIHLTSNSYGGGPNNFDPWDPLAVAFWYAYINGVVVVKSAGNSGGQGSIGELSRAPFVLSVGAAAPDDSIAGFSSQGTPDGPHNRLELLRTVNRIYTENLDEYSWCSDSLPVNVKVSELEIGCNNNSPTDSEAGLGLRRPGVLAKGHNVYSATSPTESRYARTKLLTREANTSPLYGRLSGTSMACPTAAGVAAVFLSAWKDQYGEIPNPSDTITTIEATANSGLSDQYTAASAGAGYVDARAAVKRAVAGDLATPSEITFEEERTPCVETIQDEGEQITTAETVSSGKPTQWKAVIEHTIEEDFVGALPNRRLVVELYNGVQRILLGSDEQDLGVATLTVDRKVGEDTYRRIGKASHEGVTDTETIELVLDEADVYEGPGVDDGEVSNPVVIEPGESYRLTVVWEYPNPDQFGTVLDFTVEAYREGEDC